ncbi:hypothetical protein OHA70_08205 [Kribbella sp. NBC_00382]|uniref:hypothetical protein n=1 Tax=Kribbella sp. NBC_00382 TaxID=2975967 RepID=UPI002E1AB27D
MNTQPNLNAPTDKQPETDPIGPIMVPVRSTIGARALALVGTVGFAALAVAVADTCSTWPTISVN